MPSAGIEPASLPSPQTMSNFLCPWQESNLHHFLRREVFYPLDYRDIVRGKEGTYPTVPRSELVFDVLLLGSVERRGRAEILYHT